MQVLIDKEFQNTNKVVISTGKATWNISQKGDTLEVIATWISPKTGKTIIDRGTLNVVEDQDEATQKNG